MFSQMPGLVLPGPRSLRLIAVIEDAPHKGMNTVCDGLLMCVRDTDTMTVPRMKKWMERVGMVSQL